MKPVSRRKFVVSAAAVMVTGAASATNMTEQRKKYPIVHHVFFWLKNPISRSDRDQLIAGIKTLGKISKVKELHVGVVANTEKRDVVDQSWDVSELMFFNNLEDQASYQSDPIHQAFIKNCSHLWEKVVVYDMQEA